jgi:hypothetical protein
VKCLIKVFALCVLSGIPAISARSQDPNTELMKKLYTKIGQAVGVGDNNPVTGESFLILANTGILLDPSLNYNTPAGRYEFSKAVDKVLVANWIYGTTNNTVMDVYKHILDDHEAAAIRPTAAQVAQYKQQCRVIFTDCHLAQPGTFTRAYLRYDALTRRLLILNKQAEDYRRKNQTDDLPAELLSDLQSASDQLDLIGNKTAIETAKAIINTYEHVDPNAWWGELLGRFAKNSETYNGNRFGNLNVEPSYSVWLDMNRGWTALNLSQADLEQSTSSSHTSVGGGAGFNLGLFSLGTDYQKTENRQFYRLDGSAYSIAMELMRVALDRPWMDAGVFESRAWQFLQGTAYYKKLIATGVDANASKTPPATDIMPFIPTGLLVARRVSLTAAWANDLATSFNQQTSAGGSVGWGPFSFSGRYNSADQNTYHRATAAGNTLSWEAPQIIGFFVQVLPRSPFTDPCYRFPSDVTGPPLECNQLATLTNTLSNLSFRISGVDELVNSKTLLALSKNRIRNAKTQKLRDRPR